MTQFTPLSERPTANRPPHEVLRYGITQSILDEETALFDVLPGIGKSRSITKVASGTGLQITVLTNLTENYGQYQRWGEEDGVSVKELPTSGLCPTLRGDFPKDPVAVEAREAYEAAWSVSAIHQELNVPCNRGEHICPYRERLDEIRPDGSDTLVGFFTQAYNPRYVEDRVVVLDERCFENYIRTIYNPVDKAEEFLSTLDDFPFNGLPYKPSDTDLTEAIAILEEVGLEPGDHQDAIGEFHAKAPLITYALLKAEPLENDWFVAQLPGDRTATFYQRPGKGPIHLLDPPDLSGAKSVIALDATPCISNWQRIIGNDLSHYRLFDEGGRNGYLQEQGYEFIQLNDYVWPVSGGDVSVPRCEAYLRAIIRKHDQRPDLITSKKLISELEDEGLEHLWSNDLHYGGLRGKNDLEDSELLVVLGSPSRADGDIKFQAALHGECAEPATDETGERLGGHDLDYQCEIANDLLETIRRGEVLQAAMRAGRTEESQATVYIATGMVPHWLKTKKAGGEPSIGSFDACVSVRSEGERQVIEALRGADDMTPREFYNQVDISKGQAKKHRQVLQELGLVEKEGERRWARYSDNGLQSVNKAGRVNLSLSVCSPYNSSNRADTPIEPDVPHRRDTPLDPLDKYPDWMLELQHRARRKWEEKQLDQRWPSNSWTRKRVR